MIEVTQEEFFERMGPLDVHPDPQPLAPVGNPNRRYSTCLWKLRGKDVIGKSKSDTWGIEASKYFLPKGGSNA